MEGWQWRLLQLLDVNRRRKLVNPFGKSNISLLSGGDILQECSSCEQGNEKISQSFWKVQYISCLEVTSSKNAPVVNRGMRKLVNPFGKSNISYNLVWR